MTAARLPNLLDDHALVVSPLFATVVHAIDFSPASLAAARWTSQHVARGSEAVFAHAVPQDDAAGTGWRTPAPDDVRDPVDGLSGALDGFAATLNAAQTRSVVRSGRPSDTLTRIASEVNASLVVLGRRADANRKRVGEPNVLERLARRTAASVLVVPEGISQPPTFVVAAVDESEFCGPVLQTARWIATAQGCPLFIVHVLSPAEGAYDRVIRPRGDGRRIRAPRSAGEGPRRPGWMPLQTTRWLVSLLGERQRDARARIDVRVGDPAREISARALEEGTGLVVVGHRGADGAPRGSLGSVSRELLTRGTSPVLAVNR